MIDLHTNTSNNLSLKAWHPAVQQAVFRRLVTAFSYPGRIETICGDLEGDQADVRDSALLHVLATLIDPEVLLADPDQLIATGDLSRLEACISQPDSAQFIVSRGDRAPQFIPLAGTLESPENGATVILCVARLGEGSNLHLTGPGINGTAVMQVRGLDRAWLAARSNWNVSFPLGVDMLLVDTQCAVALPRTTRISCDPNHKGEF